MTVPIPDCTEVQDMDMGIHHVYYPSTLLAYGEACRKDALAAQAFKLDSTAKVAVDAYYHWQPIETCPRGCKVQLLGKGGVAQYGIYNGVDEFWTGWAPLPTKPKE